MATISISLLNMGFRDTHIFQKCSYIIYNKIRTSKASKLISYDPQLAKTYPVSSVAFRDFVLLEIVYTYFCKMQRSLKPMSHAYGHLVIKIRKI